MPWLVCFNHSINRLIRLESSAQGQSGKLWRQKIQGENIVFWTNQLLFSVYTSVIWFPFVVETSRDQSVVWRCCLQLFETLTGVFFHKCQSIVDCVNYGRIIYFAQRDFLPPSCDHNIKMQSFCLCASYLRKTSCNQSQTYFPYFV